MLSWGMTRAESKREAEDKGGLAGPRVDGGFPGGPPGTINQLGSRKGHLCVSEGGGGRTLGPLNSFLILKSLFQGWILCHL